MSLAVPRKSVLEQWFYEPKEEPVTFDDILLYLGKYKKITRRRQRLIFNIFAFDSRSKNFSQINPLYFEEKIRIELPLENNFNNFLIFLQELVKNFTFTLSSYFCKIDK